MNTILPAALGRGAGLDIRRAVAPALPAAVPVAVAVTFSVASDRLS